MEKIICFVIAIVFAYFWTFKIDKIEQKIDKKLGGNSLVSTAIAGLLLASAMVAIVIGAVAIS